MRQPSIIALFPRFGVAVLGAALAFGHAPQAHAAPNTAAGGSAAPDAATKKAAREAYNAGEKAYGAGDYTGAYEHFKKANGLIPSINAEYWMAMAQSYGSDVGAAYDALAAVVGSPDAQKLGDEKLGTLTARLAEVKKTPASVRVSSTPPGADVSLDGASQPGMTPLTLTVPAGLHKIGVALRGYEPFEAEFLAKPGQKVEQNAELKEAAAVPEAAPAPPPPTEEPTTAPPPKEKRNPLPAYITLGVAGVGAIVGTIFGIQALGAKSDFDKEPTNDNADRAERNALIADMSFGVALTLGITGVVLLVSGDDSGEGAPAARDTHFPKRARARLDVAPVLTETTQGAAARFTF